jgi:hypothetical protein
VRVKTDLWRVALVGLLALSACGDGEESTASTATGPGLVEEPEGDEPDTASGEVELDDPRLIGGFQEVELNLADPTSSSEVADVLNFSAGAGDLPFCDEYFDGERPSIAEDIGFDGDTDPETGEALASATVGHAASICLAGWSPEAVVEIEGPDGVSTMHEAGSSEPTRGPGVELAPMPADEEGDHALELRTFPGASTGSYEITVQGLDRTASFSILVGTTQDTDRPGVPTFPVLFNIDRYADFNELTPLEPGTVTGYGAAGYPPGSSLDLAVFRSDQPMTDDQLAGATMLLVDQTTMEIDERGEGLVAFALDESTAGHCFFAIDVVELASVDMSDGLFRAVAGRDGKTFCVEG